MYNILLCYIHHIKTEKAVEDAGFSKSQFASCVTTAK